MTFKRKFLAYMVPMFGVEAAYAQASNLLPQNMKVVDKSASGSPVIMPSDQLVAGLVYDGTSSFGARAQDFESAFDQYDLFLIEDFETMSDFSLGMFQSLGFGSVNPFRTTDVGVRIFLDNGSGLPGADSYTGHVVLKSNPGVGFFDGSTYITDFGGQCLPPGTYFLVWAAVLDSEFGASFFRVQAGESTAGGGSPDNAWWWNPGGGVFPDPHEPVIVEIGGTQTGVNYLLFGEPANCSNPCAGPNCPADLDFDGDADADDFFLFLDLFSAGDPCADLDQNGTVDADDFFAYLDLFAQGCP